MAENSAAILAVVGTAGLAYILTRPENQRAINSSLSNLSQAIGQVENQVANLAVPAAIEALKQLDQTKQQLKSFQEKLALIDKVLPIAKEYLGLNCCRSLVYLDVY
jgi:coenzyme F420-reducing hydrogenase beta subunit